MCSDIGDGGGVPGLGEGSYDQLHAMEKHTSCVQWVRKAVPVSYGLSLSSELHGCCISGSSIAVTLIHTLE